MRKKRGRMPDEDRMLRALHESGRMSNQKLLSSLGLDSDRYSVVKEKLLDSKDISKYQCYSGGVELTPKGEKRAKALIPKKVGSAVSNEKALYEPLVSLLKQVHEDDTLKPIVLDTSSVRLKGKWQNPDVVEISVRHYPMIRKHSVYISTYEVKQWGRFNTDAVFEAASHKRFSHDANLVIEWPDDPELSFDLTSSDYRIDEIARECQRFGIGLWTMTGVDTGKFTWRSRIESEVQRPTHEDLDSFLEALFASTNISPKILESYENLFSNGL